MNLLVATQSGCRVHTGGGAVEVELAGKEVGALAPESGDSCLAIIDEREIWRRDVGGSWSPLAQTDIALQSITCVDGTLFAGGMDEATVLRIACSGQVERLLAFDRVQGRGEWFAGGPPLGVRSLTATADGLALLAAVHVGGIPLSFDKGESWTPTIPIMFDVHEVQAHPESPNLVAAAAAVGLCLSQDAGRTWKVFTQGLELTNSLAVAVLPHEVLFSIQDGPFAKRSQVWRWPIGSEHLEQVRDGLPLWLDGKVDTAHIAANGQRAAVADGAGNLWFSTEGSHQWQRITSELPYVSGMLIL